MLNTLSRLSRLSTNSRVSQIFVSGTENVLLINPSFFSGGLRSITSLSISSSSSSLSTPFSSFSTSNTETLEGRKVSTVNFEKIKIKEPYKINSLHGRPLSQDALQALTLFLREIPRAGQLGYLQRAISNPNTTERFSWLDEEQFPQQRIYLDLARKESESEQHSYSVEVDFAGWLVTVFQHRGSNLVSRKSHVLDAQWLLYFKTIEWPASSEAARARIRKAEKGDDSE